MLPFRGLIIRILAPSSYCTSIAVCAILDRSLYTLCVARYKHSPFIGACFIILCAQFLFYMGIKLELTHYGRTQIRHISEKKY